MISIISRKSGRELIARNLVTETAIYDSFSVRGRHIRQAEQSLHFHKEKERILTCEQLFKFFATPTCEIILHTVFESGRPKKLQILWIGKHLSLKTKSLWTSRFMMVCFRQSAGNDRHL